MKYFFIVIFALFSNQAYAMFCPTNFNTINIGDTIAAVEQQCGKPNSKKTHETKTGVAEEWNYYVQPDPTAPTSTLKMTIALLDNKIFNITVNGTSLVSTQICGPTINVGDSTPTLTSACGKPAFINGGQKQPSEKTTEVTEFTYNGTPSVVLTFEDGKLTEKK
ncbi:MAG TPA: DUF2845 domain-containing protein [Gammaproteobacteria bacterium]|nr:DUF2845 domain-containing protein [Gammaproteobacteria bacterium]